MSGFGLDSSAISIDFTQAQIAFNKFLDHINKGTFDQKVQNLDDSLKTELKGWLEKATVVTSGQDMAALFTKDEGFNDAFKSISYLGTVITNAQICFAPVSIATAPPEPEGGFKSEPTAAAGVGFGSGGGSGETEEDVSSSTKEAIINRIVQLFRFYVDEARRSGDRSQQILKLKELRDFLMTIRTSYIHQGGIYIGDNVQDFESLLSDMFVMLDKNPGPRDLSKIFNILLDNHEGSLAGCLANILTIRDGVNFRAILGIKLGLNARQISSLGLGDAVQRLQKVLPANELLGNFLQRLSREQVVEIAALFSIDTLFSIDVDRVATIEEQYYSDSVTEPGRYIISQSELIHTIIYRLNARQSRTGGLFSWLSGSVTDKKRNQLRTAVLDKLVEFDIPDVSALQQDWGMEVTLPTEPSAVDITVVEPDVVVPSAPPAPIAPAVEPVPVDPAPSAPAVEPATVEPLPIEDSFHNGYLEKITDFLDERRADVLGYEGSNLADQVDNLEVKAWLQCFSNPDTNPSLTNPARLESLTTDNDLNKELMSFYHQSKAYDRAVARLHPLINNWSHFSSVSQAISDELIELITIYNQIADSNWTNGFKTSLYKALAPLIGFEDKAIADTVNLLNAADFDSLERVIDVAIHKITDRIAQFERAIRSSRDQLQLPRGTRSLPRLRGGNNARNESALRRLSTLRSQCVEALSKVKAINVHRANVQEAPEHQAEVIRYAENLPSLFAPEPVVVAESLSSDEVSDLNIVPASDAISVGGYSEHKSDEPLASPVADDPAVAETNSDESLDSPVAEADDTADAETSSDEPLESPVAEADDVTSDRDFEGCFPSAPTGSLPATSLPFRVEATEGGREPRVAVSLG